MDASKLIGSPTRQEYEAAVAAGAVSYSATRFLGRGKYETHLTASLEEARAHTKAMGPRAMLYAINADGRQVLIEAGGKPVKPT